MAEHDPLRKHHQQAEASLLPYAGAPGVEIVETFGDIEAEYAALRNGCVLLDQPQRATVVVRGADRREFLNRMLTQELKTVRPWRCVRSFWLNRKGRIDADLRVLELEDRTLFDVDVLAAPRVVETLGAFLFAEDVEIADASAAHRRLALHGPTAVDTLASVCTHAEGAPLSDLAPGAVSAVRIGEAVVLVDRQDSTGEIGLELLVPTEHVERIYNALAERGVDGVNGNGPEQGAPPGRYRMRLAGWHAYNIARIEAGWPVYNIDFGPNSLPHETGVLNDRVSFSKGCYLGQEVVARMHSRGHSKQQLVGLRRAAPFDGDARLPVSGAQVFVMQSTDEGDAAEIVGAVTSSTLSPMLEGEPVCFAQVKHKWSETGATLLVNAEDTRIEMRVQPQLAFWNRA
ncbi:MAG: aminomethyl transferase family protein [Phycisphaerales bacterium]|nr:MAG: aminomethyl transferase family protein [Phycisphaerales bacterium]